MQWAWFEWLDWYGLTQPLEWRGYRFATLIASNESESIGTSAARCQLQHSNHSLKDIAQTITACMIHFTALIMNNKTWFVVICSRFLISLFPSIPFNLSFDGCRFFFKFCTFFFLALCPLARFISLEIDLGLLPGTILRPTFSGGRRIMVSRSRWVTELERKSKFKN